MRVYLELKQGILILLQLQELRVDAIEKRLSEARNHIELLKQRVHVADWREIKLDSKVSVSPPISNQKRKK